MLDEVQRHALALLSAGAEVDVGASRAKLDADLNEVPVTSTLDPDELALRRALGVA